jgi:hypothetical protein
LISAAMQLCRKPWIWTSDMNLFLGVCPRIWFDRILIKIFFALLVRLFCCDRWCWAASWVTSIRDVT